MGDPQVRCCERPGGRKPPGLPDAHTGDLQTRRYTNLTGIRSRHPDWPADEIESEFRRQ
jgi:hypothetical protein